MPCQGNARAGRKQAYEPNSPRKIDVTSKFPVGNIPVVTLIRTDTTLDHSQKAEKVWLHRNLGVYDLKCENVNVGIHVLVLVDISMSKTAKLCWGPKAPQKLMKSH